MSPSQLGHLRWLAFLYISATSIAVPRARAQHPDFAHAQRSVRGGDTDNLDSLIAHALAVNPMLAAARERVSAARARVAPAGARPDPMLMAGVQNEPLGRETPMVSSIGVTGIGPEPMTMHVIGVSQTIPYPGKLALRTTAAQRDVDAALATVADARANLVRDVRIAYYELAYLDQAIRITAQNRALLENIVRTTEARYSVGSGLQQDVLKARLDLANLAQQANALHEQRRAQLAALNAMLDWPSETPLDSARIPRRIARVAIQDSLNRIRFASTQFGAPVADSSFPPLEMLQAMAISNNTMLREHEARIAAQAARLALAQKAAKPDIDVSLEYGQRNGLTDMVSAIVSVPVPLQHARKQDASVASERAELSALQAEHHAQVNELQARIAALYADAERERTQLALNAISILPQARGSLSAATAEYQAGRADIMMILQSRAVLFTYEMSYYRTLADFAETVAGLEQAVGKEVLP